MAAFFVLCGICFLQMAVPEFCGRKPGMMAFIFLAIPVALVCRRGILYAGAEGGFFWELVTLIDAMLLDHWMEMRRVRQASHALDGYRARSPGWQFGELQVLIPEAASP